MVLALRGNLSHTKRGLGLYTFNSKSQAREKGCIKK